MKGSWKQSARNIKYNGNTVECELRTIKGNWTRNKMQYFPDLEYNNNDGKFEWKNCRNNVEIHNNSHQNICRRYKKITIQQCLDNLTNEYDDWFEIEKSYVKCTKDKCISISFFKKNSDNTFDNEFSVNEESWIKKYYEKLVHNLNNFKYNDFCVNLYLGNNLSHYITEFSKYPFLNIFLMKSESIGANPGAMWRFMDITNKNYKTVFVLDIDDLKWSSRIRLLEQFKDYKLCSTHSGDVTITNEPYCPAYNFCTINASGIISKPQKFDYNIVDVMKGFINLCKNREKSANPYCFDDNDPITYWNQPVQGHKYGWGRIPTKYAFDEFFLKHVVYYDAYPDFKQV